MNAALALLLIMTASVPASEFTEANEAALKGDYDTAITRYNALIAGGSDGADVYYNLGNVSFASGRVGLAVLSYERALMRNPGDQDTKHNLSIALKSLGDDAIYSGSGKASAEGFFRRLPVAPVIVPALAFWAAFFIVLFLRRAFPGNGWGGTAVVILGGLAMVFCLLAGGAIWAREFRPLAVVMSASAELKEGPSVSYRTIAELKEGLPVGVEADESNWYRVRLDSGVTGWVKRETVEKI